VVLEAQVPIAVEGLQVLGDEISQCRRPVDRRVATIGGALTQHHAQPGADLGEDVVLGDQVPRSAR
jgi:hypothetical protein